MLILSNPAPEGWAIKSLADINIRDESEEPIPIKTTLLVAPDTLLEQWKGEIETHVIPGVLKWGLFHESYQEIVTREEIVSGEVKRTRSGRASRRVDTMKPEPIRTKKKDPISHVQDMKDKFELLCMTPDGQFAPIHELDVVMISYEHLRDQLKLAHRKTIKKSLLRYGFWRVCLDEAQLIARSSSVAAVVASMLWRRHAWVITGTPITKDLGEVRGLLEFLNMKPFFSPSMWTSLIEKSYKEKLACGLLCMKSLLQTVMLRRSKREVDAELQLPPCERIDMWVDLSLVERVVYDLAKQEFMTTAGNWQLSLTDHHTEHVKVRVFRFFLSLLLLLLLLLFATVIIIIIIIIITIPTVIIIIITICYCNYYYYYYLLL